MARLDDFLSPLDHGVWEVTVPKTSVTEPPDDWVKSAINVPAPGVTASYRKGHYHAHEMDDEWKVHVDTYDPAVHPFLHLADDAPLLLMIGDTFLTLIADTRETIHDDHRQIVAEQERSVWLMAGAGMFLVLMGLIVATDPLFTFNSLLINLLRIVIVLGGLAVIATAFSFPPLRFASPGRLVLGTGIFVAGVIFAYLPSDWLGGFVLLVIFVWALASAFISFRRLYRYGRGVPEGFRKRLVMGVCSLALGIVVVLVPDATVVFLVLVIGLLLALVGILIITRAAMLHKRMHATRSPPAAPPA